MNWHSAATSIPIAINIISNLECYALAMNWQLNLTDQACAVRVCVWNCKWPMEFNWKLLSNVNCLETQNYFGSSHIPLHTDCRSFYSLLADNDQAPSGCCMLPRCLVCSSNHNRERLRHECAQMKKLYFVDWLVLMLNAISLNWRGPTAVRSEWKQFRNAPENTT